MKKLTDIITHDFGWKILSLVTAVAVWFIIVNITNPTVEQTVPVMLRIDGEEALQKNNSVLLNKGELASTMVNLTLRGSRTNLLQASQTRNNGELYAYIDLTPIDISRSIEMGKRLPIRVKYGSSAQSYDVLTCVPGEVHVVLDRYMRQAIPVTVEKIGDDAEGYISSEPVITPSSVTVSGPMSIVSMITEVKATVEMNGATEPFETVRPIEILNAEGGAISGIEADAEEVGIFIAVSTYATIPVSTPIIKGAVAEGYRVTSVRVSPREIEVEGNSADIRALNAILPMDIDTTGISRTKVVTYDMRAYLEGTNLSVREGAESRVVVTVTVEREITKEILVPVDRIEIRGMTTDVTLPPVEVVRLEVQGIAAEIVDYEQSEYVCYIDVTDLEPGTHILNATLVTPEGIQQTGSEPVEVVISETVDGDAAEGEGENEGEEVDTEEGA